MNKNHAKRQRDIKTKLMAAICMLLVSSIMMVSTTYAWFTLSTAPEVTGITTAVGANGNLEMALMPVNGLTAGNDFGITSSTGDSMATQDATLANITWGNLVDLSNSNFYGMNKITLYPSALNVATKDAQGNPLTLDLAALLQTPAYGADGRVSELLKNTVTSTYDTTEENFPQNEEYGVRAIGTASGMTDRQLAYRNARAAASTAMAQAKTLASQSLNTNGAALANIALAHGVDSNATHTQADVASLQAIINDLLGIEYVADSSGEATYYQMKTVVAENNGDGTTTDVTYYSYHTADADHPATHKVSYTGAGVLDYIEGAYKNYIIAYAASGASSMTDEEFKVFQSSVNSLTVYETADKLGDAAPGELTDYLLALENTRKNVEEANTKLDAITAEQAIAWSTISEPLYKLADTDAMKINGHAANTVKDNMSAIVNSVASGGLTVTIATGGGVYADIADHCGNFTASIVIKEVSYGGMTLNNMNAKMETATTVNPSYLSVMGSAVETAGAPTGEGGQIMPISDMYGYIIDLAFRTNAAESNLLLQVDAADRIYSDNGEDAETMGHGSSMTFTSTTTDFTLDQMKALMGAIRIVFFDPANSNAVLATAKLDMVNTTDVGGNTVTAKLYLYTLTAGGTTYTAVATQDLKNDGSVQYYTTTDNVVYNEVENETAITTDGTVTYYTATTTAAGETKLTNTDAIITALTQNTAKAVSVLVYLDGANMGNDDVAATAATSMTGSMNLQFASSANLVPMEYTPLQTQGGTSTGGTGESEDSGSTTNYTFTPVVPENSGITVHSTSPTDGSEDYVFTLENTQEGTTYTVTYKVGEGESKTLTADTDGKYTIPKADITGNITITVTAN